MDSAGIDGEHPHNLMIADVSLHPTTESTVSIANDKSTQPVRKKVRTFNCVLFALYQFMALLEPSKQPVRMKVRTEVRTSGFVPFA
ncbi:hypothetical protein [Endozoicomonas montiporae]|uniref:hypothetical protein n=1 Tax=Endozoicomonas montiporae TaxID=1027273 RepID=UPI000777CADA|nr:hypothetical protein [Endozoicomonas montiporae]